MSTDASMVRNADLQQTMLDMIFGYRVSQTIRAFADLSLADHLAAGPLTAAEVAAREGSAPQTTFRLMRAGIPLGLLTIDAEQRFHATALLDTLRKDAPKSLWGLVLGVTNDASWLSWSKFVESVRAGRSQATEVLGTDAFEYLRQHPAQSQQVTAAMAAVTSLWALDVADAIDTSEVKLAVDVGGAHGTLLRQLQQKNPMLRGIVFDRPHVAADVAAGINAGDFADRTQVLGGDFFKALPPADLYLLKFILHDWEDADCVQILGRCRAAMTPGGRVAIIEFVVNEADDSPTIALMDLEMLAVVGGRERSLAEFDALLAQAGLRRVAVRRLGSQQSVIEAVADQPPVQRLNS
ncbi:methyltransferase [Mycobacterium kubicae]|uniref:methyltransferase n=1 Tax=Mycobacterium kubicae TaxID=120959 RepID=UPI00163F3CA2|nr:methyltransferase [Mycobacterium kubicae]QNI05957.1 methyltransferase [Mycobacterium kubicae]